MRTNWKRLTGFTMRECIAMSKQILSRLPKMGYEVCLTEFYACYGRDLDHLGDFRKYALYLMNTSGKLEIYTYSRSGLFDFIGQKQVIDSGLPVIAYIDKRENYSRYNGNRKAVRIK